MFQFLGYALEAFVFAYLGLTLFSYQDFKWSPQLVLVELGVIMLGRMCGTLGLVAFMRLCGYDAKIPLKKQIFIWYAGMIRGAIAFGLVLRIDKEYVNRGVIITTSLMLVIFTTVVFGSTVGLLQLALMPPSKGAAVPEEKKEKALKKLTAEKDETKQNATQSEEKPEDCESYDESSSDDSSYEHMLHPN